MAVRVLLEGYGEPAFGALESLVRAAKRDDLLAPATVVVERGTVGLSVRRRLAGGPHGVANVRALTWQGLAADLASRWLARTDRRKATPAMVLEAVRAALDGWTARLLRDSGNQPASLRALARTYRELAGAEPGALDALARQSPRAAEVVALVRAARTHLEGCYDEADLLDEAVEEVQRGSGRPADLGTVVVYLPQRVGPAEQRLVVALGERLEVHLVVGLTGDPTADQDAGELAVRLGGAGLDRRGLHPPEVRWATGVRSAPSADAEVLSAFRHLMGHNAGGTPLERMAVLHCGSAPYPVLVREVAKRAGIPVHGVEARSLSSTVPGRVLLGALSLPDRDWRRGDVAAWMASGPILHDGRPLAAVEWDVVSGDAGVVAGLDEWRERLADHGRRLRVRAAWVEEAPDGGTEAAGRAAAMRAQAVECGRLRTFVEWLAARLTESPVSWRGWADWAAGLLAELLGGPAGRAGWPVEEVAAFDAMGEVLQALGQLDGIRAEPPAPTEVRTALTAALDVPAPQTSRAGHGLLVGRLPDAVGLDLDVVCVVGVVEGAFPAPADDDVLVPDRERLQAGGVPLRGGTHAEAQRDSLAALAAAGETVLSYPRWDQRKGRPLRPARLLLDTLSHLRGHGRRVYASELAGVTEHPDDGAARMLDVVASYVTSVASPGGDPLSPNDWELRNLTRDVLSGRRIEAGVLARGDPVLSRSIRVRQARRGAEFTRFDGLAGGDGVPSPAGGAAQAVTRLEDYARCPRRYLFGELLRLTERDLPESVLDISPADRGALIHRVLHRLFAEEVSGARRSGADVDRLEAVAGAAFVEAERDGVTGHPVLWQLRRSEILATLRQFVVDDAADRDRSRAMPVALEESFGTAEGDPGLQLGLGDGRTLHLRGRIDRVDRIGRDGLRVVDYKSGAPFDVMPGDDPVAGGTQLQPASYALAARRRHSSEGPVDAGYWFVGKEPAPTCAPVDASVEQRLAEVLRAIVDGIESGQFPARPGARDEDGDGRAPDNCSYCPFDRICPPDRVASWSRKRDDPVLAGYVALAEPAAAGAP